jgi:hypothetical protein
LKEDHEARLRRLETERTNLAYVANAVADAGKAKDKTGDSTSKANARASSGKDSKPG